MVNSKKSERSQMGGISRGEYHEGLKKKKKKKVQRWLLGYNKSQTIETECWRILNTGCMSVVPAIRLGPMCKRN